jgi:hypothetical protein
MNGDAAGSACRGGSPRLASAATSGHAFTLNNDGERNGVVVLTQNADGTLIEPAGSPFATGGRGLMVPAGGDFDARDPCASTVTTCWPSTPAATAWPCSGSTAGASRPSPARRSPPVA